MAPIDTMTPIEQLEDALKQDFPDAEFVIRKADNPTGFRFLNVYSEDLEVAVEWKQDHGFGLSCFHRNDDKLNGLYGTPDEWFKTPEAVFHRIASLLLDEQTTTATPSTVSEMRRQRGMSQANVSAILDITQATYSKLERREDMLVSTLRKVVEAMGGILRIEAQFPDSQDVREITFQ